MAANVALIATGNPTTSATPERRARSIRRSTSATQSAASGPNSGPTTIAPMIRTIESVRMPTPAIIVASTMKARKLPESSVPSDVRASTSSQTTASAGEPRAARSARRAVSDTAVSTLSSTIVPTSSRPRLQRSSTTMLASSRATSHVTRSPGGRSATPRRWTIP